MLSSEAPIVALATPPGQSGLAVVRISGEQAVTLADRIFRFGKLPQATDDGAIPSAVDQTETESARSLAELPGYKAAFGYIWDSLENKALDQCVALRFKAPYSYTGEDVIEFSFHGGAYLRRRVVELICIEGAVPASAGEFTKRAFLNGKIDLSQAEAVMDLISAENKAGAELAIDQLSGAVAAPFRRMRASLYELLAGLEINIEYPEYEDFDFDARKLPQALQSICAELQEFIDSYKQTSRLRDGLRVVLVGPPNVGKSSLLNALSGAERAIVSDIKGTTRDTLDMLIDINGIPVRLIDTAGLRESLNQIEQMGIQRTKDEVSKADYLLWTWEPEQLLSTGADTVMKEINELLLLREDQLPCTVLLNKNDQSSAAVAEDLLKREILPTLAEKTAVSNMSEDLTPPLYMSVSATTADGLPALKEAIFNVYCAMGAGRDSKKHLSSERQLAYAEQALRQLRNLCDSLEYLPQDICAQTILAAAETLACITGENPTDTMLDELFSRFCVGK